MGNDVCKISKKEKDLEKNTEFGIIDCNFQENDLNILEQTTKFRETNSKINNEKTINLEKKLNEYGNFIRNEEIEEVIKEKIKNMPDFENINKIDLKIHHKEFNTIQNNPVIKFKKDGTIYQGSWNSNYQKEGYGIYIIPDVGIYEGMYKNDFMDNYGIFIDKNGNYYKGNQKNGKEEGNGELFIKDKFKYNGEFSNDYQNGKGKEENLVDGSIYEGDFVNGIKNGKGKLTFKNGTTYIGDFKNGKFDGEGIINFVDGRIYRGEFQNNMMNGKGEFIWKDGSKYIGNYKNNQKHGFGKYEFNRNKYYEGYWYNNKQHGEGFYFFNGKKLKGLFRFGKIIMKQN